MLFTCMIPTALKPGGPTISVRYTDSKERANDGTRTRDLLITNQLLYQLSYIGVHSPDFASLHNYATGGFVKSTKRLDSRTKY